MFAITGVVKSPPPIHLNRGAFDTCTRLLKGEPTFGGNRGHRVRDEVGGVRSPPVWVWGEVGASVSTMM